MADDFDAGICSGSWWTAARINSTTAGFDATSGSMATDTLMPPISGFGLSPIPGPMDWNNIERDETRFHHHLLQETPNYFGQDSSPSSSNLVTAEEAGHHQQQFLLGQQSIYEPTSCLMMGSNINYEANDSLANFTKLLGTSPPKHQSGTSASNQLQFSNNAPFWNPSAVQFVAQSFEQKPNCSSTTTTKSNTYSTTKKTTSSSSGETSLKKPRLETPSPLPTFKVRKEKLGDRITALQQLVSPFGKTDTASVLHEAIEYIKFLHEQVNALSTPYMKNGQPMQHQQDAGEVTKHDLRSWGLCLVPTESIYPVASEAMTDFWTPTFGGTYR